LPDRVADVMIAVTHGCASWDWRSPNRKSSNGWTRNTPRDHDPDGYVEVQGIAEGFGIALMHCSRASTATSSPIRRGAVARRRVHRLGRTARHGHTNDGTRRGQESRHPRRARGTAVPFARGSGMGGLRILCVSGPAARRFLERNQFARLAVADTQVGTFDHGEGWLRSFLMTRLLRECATVAEAVGSSSACRTPVADAAAGRCRRRGRGGRVGTPCRRRGAGRQRLRRAHQPFRDRAHARAYDLAPPDDIAARSSRAPATLEHALRDLPLPFELDSIRALDEPHGDSASAGCAGTNDEMTRARCPAPSTTAGPPRCISRSTPCVGRWQRMEPYLVARPDTR
jgi:hypothetical protein